MYLYTIKQTKTNDMTTQEAYTTLENDFLYTEATINKMRREISQQEYTPFPYLEKFAKLQERMSVAKAMMYTIETRVNANWNEDEIVEFTIAYHLKEVCDSLRRDAIETLILKISK